MGLNPLKRVNSILTKIDSAGAKEKLAQSQSPQAGQFNSYAVKACRGLTKVPNIVSIPSSGSIQFLQGGDGTRRLQGQGSQSPQAGQFNSYLAVWTKKNIKKV